ncbi:hypothetical protein BON22_4625 [Cyberlindnera fabianii]|uniref:Uncharacterized protein n=1 Tax=Cyberlindnera fabianii TaxID=36022 RepID=A0A1V2L382_CYBFA|nr:hypothetical protein BON22_4625 [Cyberlindnera fabianii]
MLIKRLLPTATPLRQLAAHSATRTMIRPLAVHATRPTPLTKSRPFHSTSETSLFNKNGFFDFSKYKKVLDAAGVGKEDPRLVDRKSQLLLQVILGSEPDMVQLKSELVSLVKDGASVSPFIKALIDTTEGKTDPAVVQKRELLEELLTFAKHEESRLTGGSVVYAFRNFHLEIFPILPLPFPNSVVFKSHHGEGSQEITSKSSRTKSWIRDSRGKLSFDKESIRVLNDNVNSCGCNVKIITIFTIGSIR